MRSIVLTIVVVASVALLSTVLIEAQPLSKEEILSSLQRDEPQGKGSVSKEDSSSDEAKKGKTKREAAVYLTQPGGGPYSPNSVRVFSRKEYRTLPNGNIVIERAYYFMNGTKVPPSAMESRVIMDSSSQESSSEEGRGIRVLGKREADPQGMMKEANPGMYGYPGRIGGQGIFVGSSSQGISSSEEHARMWARGKREVGEMEDWEEPEALVRSERSPKKKGHGSSSSLYSQLYGN